MVEALWNRDGSDAIDGRLLAAVVRDSGAERYRGVSGERAAYQESAGAQDGRARVPMADEIAHLRVAEQFFSAAGEDSDPAHVLAAERRSRSRGGHLHSADSEGADADECPDRKRD